MKAVVLNKPCKAHELQVTEVPIPSVRLGWVLIRIRAFGINRSEIYTRNGFSPNVKLPRIIGIECVGEVVDPSDSQLKKGQKVISLMGGLGREFDGSYAEYTLIPTEQVYLINSSLNWNQLATIPETYYTAYGSLFASLRIESGQSLLIRGATSAAGLAALQLAKVAGLQVYATTRSKDKMNILYQYGADVVLLDDNNIKNKLLNVVPNGVDKVLELVGAATLRDSMQCLCNGGIACFTGILSGWVIDSFEPIDDIPSGCYLTSFHSDCVTQLQINNLFEFINKNQIDIFTPIIFSIDDIAKAHQLMESNTVMGKIVIEL